MMHSLIEASPNLQSDHKIKAEGTIDLEFLMVYSPDSNGFYGWYAYALMSDISLVLLLLLFLTFLPILYPKF